MQFKIHDMTRDSNDGVISVTWIAFVTDNGVTVSKTGESTFTPDPSDSGFIPFDNLTEMQVIKWVKAFEDVNIMSAQLNTELATQVNVINKNGLPWVNG
jgi:hypothetical protein